MVTYLSHWRMAVIPRVSSLSLLLKLLGSSRLLVASQGLMQLTVQLESTVDVLMRVDLIGDLGRLCLREARSLGLHSPAAMHFIPVEAGLRMHQKISHLLVSY